MMLAQKVTNAGIVSELVSMAKFQQLGRPSCELQGFSPQQLTGCGLDLLATSTTPVLQAL